MTRSISPMHVAMLPFPDRNAGGLDDIMHATPMVAAKPTTSPCACAHASVDAAMGSGSGSARHYGLHTVWPCNTRKHWVALHFVIFVTVTGLVLPSFIGVVTAGTETANNQFEQEAKARLTETRESNARRENDKEERQLFRERKRSGLGGAEHAYAIHFPTVYIVQGTV